MSFFLLLCAVGFAAFGLACLGASGLVVLLVPAPRKEAPAGDVAPLLARLFPVLTAGLVALLAVSGFLAFEPWRAEAPGIGLSLLAALGVALVARGGLRAVLALRANRDLAWRDAVPFKAVESPLPAFLVTHPFPVVAVVGLRAPRIVVARQVVDALTRQELQTVIGHELAHWRRRDNVVALALRGLPDVLGMLATGRRLEAAWVEGAERAADAGAVGEDAAARVDLAAALVKVARLAAPGPDFPLPVAAFHAGAPLANRVEVLLQPPASSAPHGASLALPAAMLVAPLMALASPFALRAIHSAVEWVVQVLR